MRYFKRIRLNTAPGPGAQFQTGATHMKSTKSIQQIQTMALAALLALGPIACDRAERTGATDATPPHQAAASLLLDDYSDAKRNSNGAERLLIDDKTAGSNSRATEKCNDGIISVSGELVPGRGTPAFISLASLLSVEGKPRDLTAYEGVHLRVKAIKGPLTVQVATSTITNFDYHASAPIGGKGGEFQDVRIPFKAMKRAWSEQTALDLKNVTSVNLVSFGMARDTFAYEVDQISFY